MAFFSLHSLLLNATLLVSILAQHYSLSYTKIYIIGKEGVPLYRKVMANMLEIARVNK